MDNKDIKSLFSSLGFILIYVYATAGLVKLFWYTKDDYEFEGRIKFMILSQILFGIIYIFGIYHIVESRHIDNYYISYLITQIGYVVIGTIANLFLKRK